MGILSKSLSREFGKNAGKWASNLIFGNKWATPYKLSVNDDDFNTRFAKMRRERETREVKEREEEARKSKSRRTETRNSQTDKHEAQWTERLATQLERLKTLVDEGFLSKEEFERIKKYILSKFERR